MKKHIGFSGVFSLLLTPFHNDKSVDWNAYERYLTRQLELKPDGLFAVCGSSEMKWLTPSERVELARRAVKSAGKTPVVATANLDSDRSRHSEEVRRMADTGLAGVVLVPPPGLGENQDELGEYFARIIDTAPCPTLLYEWPMVSPHLIEARIYGELVDHHGLAGIKDTTCTMEGIGAKIERNGKATVFQANAPFMMEAIARGAGGIMAIVTTAAADLTIDFRHAAQAAVRRRSAYDASEVGHTPVTSNAAESMIADNTSVAATAGLLHEQLVLLDCALVRGGAYPASAKHLAALRGIDMGLTCRAPAVAAGEVRKAVEVWYSHADRTGVLGAVRAG